MTDLAPLMNGLLAAAKRADYYQTGEAPLLLKAFDTLKQMQTDLDARFEHSDHQSAKYYQRWRDAEKHARMRASESADLERERDELAAVIEKMHPAGERLINSRGDEWVEIDAPEWDQILSTAPADALREHDRQVAERAWEEGARWAAVEFGKDAFVDESLVGLVPSDNPYRKEQENNNA